MSASGYKQFFKSARDAKKGSAKPVNKKAFSKAPKVDDVLNSLKRVNRRGKNVPVLPFISAVILLLASVYSYQNIEKIESTISKIEIGLFGPARAEKKEEKSSAPKEVTKEKTSTEKGPDKTKEVVDHKSWTPEQLSFFNKLEDRKLQLDAREQELQKLEEELQEQKVALEKRLRELEDLRTKISSRLDEKVKVDQEKVDKLVEFYSNMKPQNAAKVFADIDEDLAVEILNKMKKKSAADIMNLLKSDKAQRLSEKFAGYKRQ